MIEIPLAAVPNQSFSIRLEDNLYNFTIKETNGCMGVTIVRNDITILSNVRAVSKYLLIPYQYLESGNFYITTLNDDLPYWDKFGISQSLIYVTVAELAGFISGA